LTLIGHIWSGLGLPRGSGICKNSYVPLRILVWLLLNKVAFLFFFCYSVWNERLYLEWVIILSQNVSNPLLARFGLFKITAMSTITSKLVFNCLRMSLDSTEMISFIFRLFNAFLRKNLLNVAKSHIISLHQRATLRKDLSQVLLLQSSITSALLFLLVSYNSHTLV